MTLSPETRDAVREGCKRSAAAVLPVIFETLGTPQAMLDVGAGEGHWCDAAFALGVDEVYGLDVIEGAHVAPWDAEKLEPMGEWMPLADWPLWPLAICLEMAEHLTPAAGDHLVSELCRVSEAVVWSAAIPGQGGDGHVNEQWPDYWADRFLEAGWSLTDPWRDTLWMRPDVDPWYRQNLLLAKPLPVAFQDDFESPRALVDPVTWAHHRGVAAP